MPAPTLTAADLPGWYQCRFRGDGKLDARWWTGNALRHGPESNFYSQMEDYTDFIPLREALTPPGDLERKAFEITDNAVASMHDLASRAREHFGQNGLLKGDGKWRQTEIYAALSTIEAIWREVVDSHMKMLDARHTTPHSPPEPEAFVVEGRRCYIKKVQGYDSWIIYDGNPDEWTQGRLVGSGEWKAKSKVLTTDVCSWPTREAAEQFLRSLQTRGE